MGCQICHIIHLVHTFAVARGMFKFSFGVIFYTVEWLLNNFSVLMMRPLFGSGMKDKYPHMYLVLG